MHYDERMLDIKHLDILILKKLDMLDTREDLPHSSLEVEDVPMDLLNKTVCLRCSWWRCTGYYPPTVGDAGPPEEE